MAGSHTKKGTCLNCHRTMIIKGRGLCHTCYLKKDVRDQFPILWSGKSRRKRGTCLFCKDNNLQIVGRGLCNRCYALPVRTAFPLTMEGRREWSKRDIETLKHLRSRRFTAREIAKEMGRSVQSVKEAIRRYQVPFAKQRNKTMAEDLLKGKGHATD